MRTPLFRRAVISICLLFAYVASYTQTADSFYLKITHVFQNMETSRVSSGLLCDYGLDFADVKNFDGVQQTLSVSAKWHIK